MRPKVFVSYYAADDMLYRDRFERTFVLGHHVFDSVSVQRGAISFSSSRREVKQSLGADYILSADLIVVLVGTRTFARQYVDHEIATAIALERPKALLGLVLPSRSDYGQSDRDVKTLPGRLYDNLKRGYALVADWTTNPAKIQSLAVDAIERSHTIRPDNLRRRLLRNQSGTATRYGKLALPGPHGADRGIDMSKKQTQNIRQAKVQKREAKALRTNEAAQQSIAQQVLQGRWTEEEIAAREGVLVADVAKWVDAWLKLKKLG